MTPVIIDYNGTAWEQVVSTILSTSEHIIALRGAGSFNGISIADANSLLDNILSPRIESFLKEGGVTIIFDGDNDDPDFPDIGHIAGRLRDRFDKRVNFYAVQMLSWYKYRDKLPASKPLHSACGNEYQTILFPENTFTGDHNHFSQHTRLAHSLKYEQWYVGACGLIASKQLSDFSNKVKKIKGPHKVAIFKASVSIEQGHKIQEKISKGTDAEKISRLHDSIIRREKNPYGLLCTPTGEFIHNPEFSNLQIEVI